MALLRFPKKPRTDHDDASDHGPHRREDHAAHDGGGHDESNWLVSYADMMTLLCAFFIMLFSMAKINPPEYEAVRKNVSEHFGGKYDQPPAEEIARFISQVLQEAGVERDSIVHSDPMGVTLILQSQVTFDPMSALVRPSGKATLYRVIETLRDKEAAMNKRFKIVVEGHTDGKPIASGPFPSNWELSSARATRVARLFLDKGFGSDQIVAIGYGDSRPQVPHRLANGEWNPEGLTQNRRVVIRVMEPAVDTIPWDHVAETTAKAAH